MSEASPDGVCGNCVGACCRAPLFMPLSEKEASTLRSVGTELKEFLPAGDDVDWGNRRYRRQHAPETPRFIRSKVKSLGLEPGEGLYGLDSDCGFLEQTEDNKFICGIHDDPGLKPAICSSFKAGSAACREIREKVILDMLKHDSLVPSLAGVALGEEIFRNFEGE